MRTSEKIARRFSYMSWSLIAAFLFSELLRVIADGDVIDRIGEPPLALPKFSLSLEKARAAEGVELLGAIQRAQDRYCLMTGQFAGGMTCADPDSGEPALEKLGLGGTKSKYFDICVIKSGIAVDVHLAYLNTKPSNPYQYRLQTLSYLPGARCRG